MCVRVCVCVQLPVCSSGVPRILPVASWPSWGAALATVRPCEHSKRIQTKCGGLRRRIVHLHDPTTHERLKRAKTLSFLRPFGASENSKAAKEETCIHGDDDDEEEALCKRSEGPHCLVKSHGAWRRRRRRHRRRRRRRPRRSRRPSRRRRSASTAKSRKCASVIDWWQTRSCYADVSL